MTEQLQRKGIPGLIGRAAEARALWTKILLAGALVALLSLLFPRGEAIDLDYKVGAVWARKDVVAPFAFPVYRNDREYSRDLQDARRSVIPVFERDENAVAHHFANLDTIFSGIHQHLVATGHTQTRDSAGLRLQPHNIKVQFTDREWMFMTHLASYGGIDRLKNLLASLCEEYLNSGYIEGRKDSIRGRQIALKRGTIQTVLPVSILYDKADVVTLLQRKLEEVYRGDNDTVALAYKIGISLIRPNILFDRKSTDLATQAALDAVPRTLGFVQENERIVRRNERITAETKLKLESLRSARGERASGSAGLTQILGIALHVSGIVLLYGIYLYIFRKKIFGNNGRLTLIALLVLVEGCFAFASREISSGRPLEYLIVVPAASMLLTIVFDSRVGFYGTVVIAFLVAGIRGNDYSVALAALIAGALSVYTVRDLRNRTQIFRSIGFIFLGYALGILALGLERFEPAVPLLEALAIGFANAIVSPLLTYGLLILFERVFGVTTDLTLADLAHPNHPLVRRLAEKAPGTYHHSVNIAAMAEAAAQAVDANSALARAGAFFHDIGKIKKPTYFVENQKGTRNRHDKLAPRMSSLIISAHVKDGMVLAREHRLPEEVVDFIPMHHGTTRMEFFYQKALRLAENSGDETKIDEINEQDYRYPGPKPQTKETGILMLADTIEAAGRTLEDPTPQRIESLIDELVRKRFEEGELDECPLTLKDLTKIKAAFLGVLAGTYHHRIKYPEPERKAKKGMEFGNGAAPEKAEQSQGTGDT